MDSLPNHSSASKTAFNADFCGSIPLNLINLIQAHGALLVLERNELTIVQTSSNSEEILGVPPEELLNNPLSRFIEEKQLGYLKEQLQRQGQARHVPLHLHWQLAGEQRALTGLVYDKEAYLLLELEPQSSPETNESFIKIYQEISLIVSALKEASSVEELSGLAANELKKRSGFDKVMVYRFDAGWNGEVIAEAHEPGMPSYLGLHFPASDIPRQARELYLQTPYRLIPDVDARAVKLYPVINPLTHRLSDIAECSLRGVPLVHIEYLKNMEVGASMSVPIAIGNRLWGLVSCHHKEARRISYELRSSFQIISGIFSAQLSALEKEVSFRYRSALHGIELKLLEQLYSASSLEEGLFKQPAYLKDLLKAGGIALLMNDSYETSGELPDKGFIQSLVKWLSRYSKEKVFFTDKLPELFPAAKKCKAVASGLMALQISAGKAYVLAFRPEVIKTVDWGGNPNEAVQYEGDTEQYHPRNSFKLWREQVEGTSEPWQPEESEVAAQVRTAVLEKLLKLSAV